MPFDEKYYHKKNKRSKSDCYKIEDKLIYEGKKIKLKTAKKVEEQIISEKKKLNFKIHKTQTRKLMDEKLPKKFLERLPLFEMFHRRNLENLRIKKSLYFFDDYPFNPYCIDKRDENHIIKKNININEKCENKNINHVEERKNENDENVLFNENIKKNKGFKNLNINKKKIKYFDGNGIEEVWPKELIHQYMKPCDENIE